MTIKKSRLAALITVMLVFSIMISLLVVPASAATYDLEFAVYDVPGVDFIASFLQENNVPLLEASYLEMAQNIAESQETVVVDKAGNVYYEISLKRLLSFGGYKVDVEDVSPVTYYTQADIPYRLYRTGYKLPDDAVFKNNLTVLYKTPSLTDTVNADMTNGVLDQIIDLLPIVLVVIIGFIGLRKGIAFLQTVLHRA